MPDSHKQIERGGAGGDSSLMRATGVPFAIWSECAGKQHQEDMSCMPQVGWYLTQPKGLRTLHQQGIFFLPSSPLGY